MTRNIKRKYSQEIMNLCRMTRKYVRINKKESRKVVVGHLLKQRSTLRIILYNIIMREVIKEIKNKKVSC